VLQFPTPHIGTRLTDGAHANHLRAPQQFTQIVRRKQGERRQHAAMRGVALSVAVSAEDIIESEHAPRPLFCPSHTLTNIPICGANFVKFIPSELMFFICKLRFSPPIDWLPRSVLHRGKTSWECSRPLTSTWCRS
jgi:hypothetical protein